MELLTNSQLENKGKLEYDKKNYLQELIIKLCGNHQHPKI